ATAMAAATGTMACGAQKQATPAAQAAQKSPTEAHADAGAAPIVVSIVIDQFAAWIIDARAKDLPKDGGFARLAREGTYVRKMAYGHAVTEPWVGHGALYTGATPKENGIFGNDVIVAHKFVAILRDEHAHLVTTDGASHEVGTSLAALKVDTLAD